MSDADENIPYLFSSYFRFLFVKMIYRFCYVVYIFNFLRLSMLSVSHDHVVDSLCILLRSDCCFGFYLCFSKNDFSYSSMVKKYARSVFFSLYFRFFVCLNDLPVLLWCVHF